jgi:carbamoyl-phosphate synthase large subunit
VPCIEHGTATTVAEAIAMAERIGFPVMCKPIDNQSSKGVFKAADPAALIAGLGSAFRQSFSGTVIVERFIEGPEYCVEGVAIDGRFKNLLSLERAYFRHDRVFVPSMLTAPTTLDRRQDDELLAVNQTICEGFGLQNGFSHSEFILNQEDGRFYLVETAARGGGVFISSHLVAHACGFDTAEFLIRLALGERLRIEDYANRGRAVRYVCFYLSAGTIREVRGLDRIRSLPGVIGFHDAGIGVGTRARGLVDKSSRLGPVLLGCADLAEIEQATQAVRETLVISTDERENAVIWD